MIHRLSVSVEGCSCDFYEEKDGLEVPLDGARFIFTALPEVEEVELSRKELLHFIADECRRRMKSLPTSDIKPLLYKVEEELKSLKG